MISVSVCISRWSWSRRVPVADRRWISSYSPLCSASYSTKKIIRKIVIPRLFILKNFILSILTFLGKRSIEKKTFSFGHCPNDGGGGLPMPEFFGPLFRSALLVSKKSLFLQKCQCIELLTVFRLHIYSIL